MMISPDSYVEMELEGKTPDEVLKCIRGLQRKMSDMKSKNQNRFRSNVCPSPQVQIDVMRDYVVAAEEYYTSIGGEYIPSQLEQRAKRFDANMEHICSITISYGGYCDGTEDRTLTRDGDKICVKREFFNGSKDDGKTFYEGMRWQDLMDELAYIHMGEWKSEYMDLDICDGTQWSVDITYDNGTRSKHFGGSNKYPYNFERFLEIMEMG